jgi:hypothetical protein
VDAAPSKASRASVWCEVREENYTDPSHALPALLGVSQTALCASLRRVPGPVSRCLIISTDNTYLTRAVKEGQYYVEPRSVALLPEASSVAT